MPKLVVELSWDIEAGPLWMNMDNLRLLLYGDTSVKPEHLKVKKISGPGRG